MTKSLKLGISHLLAEFAADAFGVLTLLAAAGAIAPRFASPSRTIFTISASGLS